MKKRKLVITQTVSQAHYQSIQEIIPDWDIITGKDSSIWENHILDAEIIAGWRKSMAQQCLLEESKLRWVQSWSAGVNSLPLEELAVRAIVLTSANGVHAYPISETIFALMLALTRKVHTYVRNQMTHTWHHSNLSLEMHKKTIGIIGVGAIGKETAKIAKAFGMRVIGLRYSGKPEDYVVVTLPLTKETYHLFGPQQFHLMKPSAFLINIGRGEVISEKHLIQALQEQKIAGAGLDVFETEPLSKASPLWTLENVIITPHTAGSTEHYDKRVIEDIFIPNLRDYVKEAIPRINLVDYVKGY